MRYKDVNEIDRQRWLAKTLGQLPSQCRLLDAGELKNRSHCQHLNYVSQDFCQYKDADSGAPDQGLQMRRWDNSRIDLVSDITDIPAPNESFDAILRSEVLEHVPEPTHALDEFARLLKLGGTLILTAPFASLVHMAPFHYCSGFSRYWYEYHLTLRDFEIVELTPNGNWYSYLYQEMQRLGGMERQRKNWSWPLAYFLGIASTIYYRRRSERRSYDIACLGWHCVAIKKN